MILTQLIDIVGPKVQVCRLGNNDFASCAASPHRPHGGCNSPITHCTYIKLQILLQTMACDSECNNLYIVCIKNICKIGGKKSIKKNLIILSCIFLGEIRNNMYTFFLLEICSQIDVAFISGLLDKRLPCSLHYY